MSDFKELSTYYQTPGMSLDDKQNYNDRRDGYRVGLAYATINDEVNADKFIQVIFSGSEISQKVLVELNILHVDGLSTLTIVGTTKAKQLVVDTPTTIWGNPLTTISNAGAIDWDIRCYYDTSGNPLIEIHGISSITTDPAVVTVNRIVYTGVELKNVSNPASPIKLSLSTVSYGGDASVNCKSELSMLDNPNFIDGTTLGIGLGKRVLYGTYGVDTTLEQYYQLLPVVGIGNVFGELMINGVSGEWIDIAIHAAVGTASRGRFVKKYFGLRPATGMSGISLVTYGGNNYFAFPLFTGGNLSTTSWRFEGMVDLPAGAYLTNLFRVVRAAEVTVVTANHTNWISLGGYAEDAFISTPTDVAANTTIVTEINN